MQPNGKNKIIAGAIIIAAVALIAIAASMLNKKDEQQASNTRDTSTSQQEMASISSEVENTADSDEGATYKDGTYTVSDTYPSPGGEEDIKVVLTLKDNAVTAVDVTQDANQRESEEYQSMFQQGYKSRVIGKAIDGLELDSVSGSSLTTQAFDEALEQIRSQAKA